jgi:hypothetical protein
MDQFHFKWKYWCPFMAYFKSACDSFLFDFTTIQLAAFTTPLALFLKSVSAGVYM